MADPILMAKAAMLLNNEKTRKGLAWIVVAIFSPVILVVVLLCCLGSGTSTHNTNAVQFCFQTGPLPAGLPDDYRVCVEEMRAHLAELDGAVSALESNMEGGDSLDHIRVKAVFYTLYFGVEAPSISQFAGCFAASETRTRTVTATDAEGNVTETEQIYTVNVPIGDMETVYANLAASLGVEVTEVQKSNVGNVYSLIMNL